jgi:hypothetical protein
MVVSGGLQGMASFRVSRADLEGAGRGGHQPEAFNHGGMGTVKLQEGLDALHSNFGAGQPQGPGGITTEVAVFIEPAGPSLGRTRQCDTPAMHLAHESKDCWSNAAVLAAPLP